MLEDSLRVERDFQVSVVVPGPVCHHEACTPRLGNWQIDWLFQYRSLPRGLEVSCMYGSEGAEFAVSF
jgi:hypothetical protein